MQISFGPARSLANGIWLGKLSPAAARRLPGAPLRGPGPHVVMLTAPAWNGAELKAPFDGVSVVALGAGQTALFLDTAADATVSATHEAASPRETQTPTPPETATPPAPTPVSRPETPSTRSNDDAAFVADCAVLGTDMEDVAKALIARIRAAYAGALTRQTNPRLFVETPDNFWSVEIQPRVGAIKLVVRTDEDALLRAGLPYESERPRSYWAMKIEGAHDVERALRFLEVAKTTAQKA